MDETFLVKAFNLIAQGLADKEKALKKEPERYPYSPRLQHGINMFLAASIQVGNVGDSFWQYADEAAFLQEFAERPIEEWFSCWDEKAMERLHVQEQSFYGMGAFALWEDENQYSPSEDCWEYLDSQDSDLLDGTDEHYLYEMMKTLGQEHYVLIREFIIRHPLISAEELRSFKIQLTGFPNAVQAVNFAYEPWEGEGYRCPVCGWTMTQGRNGLRCHSPHCTDLAPILTDEMRIQGTGTDVYRLKRGIMRYFAQPGKLELQIAAECQKHGLTYELWPHMDRFDIEIKFSDGEIWAIDAKAYRNPVILRNRVKGDTAFTTDGFVRGYYVIPSEFTRNLRNYTRIVNQALDPNGKIQCITFRTLQNRIREKEGQLHENSK